MRERGAAGCTVLVDTDEGADVRVYGFRHPYRGAKDGLHQYRNMSQQHVSI